jgi:UDP-glucose 4-epimerase
MRVLLTGGAGFIGSHLADRLVAEGDDVLIIDDLSTGKREHLPAGADFAEMDICDPELRKLAVDFRPDVISHCAAQASVIVSMAEPEFDARTNILGGINLCRAAAESHCSQFVYITTGGALYGHPQYTPLDEEHPIRPISAYGLSKWALEGYAVIFLGARMPVKILRLANVYGPRQDPHGEAGVVAIFSNRMLRDQPVSIFGDGEQTRDFVYVGDVVEAHQKAIAAAGTLTVNISTGQPLSVNELFSMLAELSGYARAPVHEAEREGEIKHVVLTSRRAEELLGWTPRVALREGLRHTLDWARSRDAD